MLPINLEEVIKEINLMGMKRWLEKELLRAFGVAKLGKLKTMDENKFEVNLNGNVQRLVQSIIERTYEPGASIAFIVFDPMVREIFAAPFRDRVVHHFLYNMQAGWWDAHFIYDSYSCRVGKGTLFGAKRVQKFMQKASNNFQEKAYVAKFDFKGYFMSIPRAQLLERIKWGLDRQFNGYMDSAAGRALYDICLFLWTKVVMDDPVKKARRRGPLGNWDPSILPPEKSLYCQLLGFGLVIGNLTSQLSSNIYLDQLDQLVTKQLGYPYYGRYVDDFILVVNERDYERLKADVPKMERFAEELQLTLHPKKRYMQDIDKGVNFLGARVYPHCLYPSDRLQAKFRQTVKGFAEGYRGFDNVQSYMGLMKHDDSEVFMRGVLEEMGFGGEFWEF